MTQDPKMSAQAIITLIKGLGEVDRQAVFAAFAIDAPAASPATAPKKAKAAKEPKAVKEPKAEKKPRANAGVGTAWSAFSTKLQMEHKAELDAVKAEAATKRAAAKAAGLPVPEDTKGAHLHWCSAYKLANKAEWEAFKADWEAKHPKGASAASSSDDTVTVVDDDSDTTVLSAVPKVMSGAVGGSGIAPAPAATSTEATAQAKRGPKKMADMTPEELAAAKAKRAAKKAAKASASNSAEGSRASSPPKVKDD